MTPQTISIVVTGFMGVGKSTVGQAVAARLGLPFVDLDERIEAAAGQSIPALFAEGEATFRWWEQQTLAALPWETPMVLATGGGALIGAGNRHLVRDAIVIVLDASLETVQARVAQEGGRPLAAQSSALYERRRAIYERIPLHLATDGRGVEEIVEGVIETARNGKWETGSTATRDGGAGHGTQDAESGKQKAESERQGTVTQEERKGKGERGKDEDASSLSAFRFPAVELSIINYQLSITSHLRRLAPTGVAIITDETIGRLWGEQVRHDVLASRLPTTLIEVPAGEAYKTLDTMRLLYDRLLAAEIDRGGLIIALGGGVVGDMAGFAAATWMRGVKGFIQMPTTLLAMVDASIGGKTGIDHPQGKNLIGAFRQPDAILADAEFLTTLPAREWRSGMAEVIKHGIIADPDLFAMIRDTPPAPPTDGAALAEVVAWLARAIRVKTEIVARDPFEQGERAKLNLGHTFGHAYETLSGFALAHGEAVALGMVTAARLSERLGIASAGLAAEIEQVLQGVGLPTRWEAAPDPETIWQAMQSDKKKAGKGLRLVLPRAIGDVMVTAPGEVEKAVVLEVISG